MILPHPLNEEQQRRSQHYAYGFNTFNGLSYICVGDTILILFGVQLGLPNWVIATLGALYYFGYLLLPLGKPIAAKVGVAQCQSICWLLRNTVAILIASTAILVHYGWHRTAIAILLVGAFTFYGFRSAGIVLYTPFIAGYTPRNAVSRVLGHFYGFYYSASLTALVVIYLLLGWRSNVEVLAGIMVVGALFGITSVWFIRHIDEPASIQQSARRPLLPQLREMFHAPVILRQIVAVFLTSIAHILLFPMAMLTVKRGYGFGDHHALLFSICHTLGACFMSFVTAPVAGRIGPRNILIVAYALEIAVAFALGHAPDHASLVFMGAAFFVIGSNFICINNALGNYFIRTIPQEQQVVASIAVNCFSGAGAGLAGLAINSSLLHRFVPTNAIPEFRHLFLATTCILLPGLVFFLRMKPLPREQSVPKAN